MPSVDFNAPTCASTFAAGNVTTITSEGNTYKKKRNTYRHSMLPQLQRLNPIKLQQSRTDDDSEGFASFGSGGLKLLDHLLSPDQRLHKSSNSNSKYWSRTRSQSPATSSGHRRSSTDESSFHGVDGHSVSSSTTSVPSMSKEEFEALPPTIRRKYFSTLERLRFAQDTDSSDTLYYSFDTLSDQHSASSPSSESFNRQRPVLKSRLAPDSIGQSVQPSNPRASLIRLHSSPVDKPRRRLDPDSCAVQSQSARQSIILDATDEALIKLGKRRPPPRSKLGNLYRPASADTLSLPKMRSNTNTYSWMDGGIKATEASIYDSFKWLEEDTALDLSLDDYHFNLRQDAENQRKSRSSSIRRHLSISSKKTFRPSGSFSRPGTQDGNNGSLFSSNSVISLQHPSGHARRRSRALSLISPSASKQQMAADVPPSPALDPASHYQDPETRMKLRAYLASPHKFDEALEFGFPAVDQAQDSTEQLPKRTDSLIQPSDSGLHRMQTLPEDRRCSVYSDGTTTAEPDSPRTPDTLEKPSLPSTRPSQDQESVTTSQGDYAQAPATSREMTLRMTLTRPDLRANEDQIYGWQKQRPVTREGPRSPTKTSTDDDFKSNIEKQLAAIDQENMATNDNRTVKRFWNRMLRN